MRALRVLVTGVLLPLAGAVAIVVAITACGGGSTTARTTTSGSTASQKPSSASSPPALGISSLTPTSGPAGSSVTLTGIGFTNVTKVEFSHQASASFGVVSDTQITAIVPAAAAEGPLTVSTPLYYVTGSPRFKPIPSISSFSPTSGAVGTEVTINGGGQLWYNTTSVLFQDAQKPASSPQSLPATVLDGGPTFLKVAVPSGAGTGKIRLQYSVSGGPAGVLDTPSAFTVVPPGPKITAVSPTHAPVGTTVTINGSILTGVTKVAFADGVQASFSVVSDTTVTFVVPAAAKTGNVSVSSPAAGSSNTVSFGVEPRVTGFSPTSGAVGTILTITGTGLAGATKVAFNGGNGSILSTTATTIRVRVPSGVMNGQITVTTLGNYTSVAPGSFTVKATAT
jgi:hypothetical protein